MFAKPRCALVDDDPSFLMLAHRYISKVYPDFDVIEFFSSVDALDFLRRSQVDLIVTDFRMPFVDGLRLTLAVRTRDANVPILVMSCDEIGREALACGANAFLKKQDLQVEIRTALERIGIHAWGKRNPSTSSA